MQKIKASGLKIGIVTGSAQLPLIERVTRDFGDFVSKDQITTAYDVKRGKPNPDPYLMGLKKAGNYAPAEGIVVENAPLGVHAGAAAGCYTVAINSGPLADSVLLNEVLIFFSLLFERLQIIGSVFWRIFQSVN